MESSESAAPAPMGVPGHGSSPYLDLERPNAARMYDYYLGGAANVSVDRIAAEEVIRAVPDTVFCARANRAFLARVVRHLAESGVDQFLDLGSGIPTAGNVHEVAQRCNPQSRTVYVDIEPVAVSYARDLLRDQPNVTIVQADIRDPDAVLSAPELARVLDLRRPVAILAMAVLHAIPDSDGPSGFLARYRDSCAPGSYLGISHLSPLTFGDAERRRSEAVYQKTPTPVVFRERDEIAGFLQGYELVEPGLVLLPQWRPVERISEADARRANSYGAVGRLSHPVG